MSVQRTIYCEGPDCNDGSPSHVSTASPPPYVPMGFIETRENDGTGGLAEHHFCGWSCAMKLAAAQPIPERIEWAGALGEEGDDDGDR